MLCRYSRADWVDDFGLHEVSTPSSSTIPGAKRPSDEAKAICATILAVLASATDYQVRVFTCTVSCEATE